MFSTFLIKTHPEYPAKRANEAPISAFVVSRSTDNLKTPWCEQSRIPTDNYFGVIYGSGCYRRSLILADDNTANQKQNLHRINVPLNLGTSTEVHWEGQQQGPKIPGSTAVLDTWSHLKTAVGKFWRKDKQGVIESRSEILTWVIPLTSGKLHQAPPEILNLAPVLWNVHWINARDLLLAAALASLHFYWVVAKVTFIWIWKCKKITILTSV